MTLCRMVGGCFVTLLAFSCRDLPVTTSRALVGVPGVSLCAFSMLLFSSGDLLVTSGVPNGGPVLPGQTTGSILKIHFLGVCFPGSLCSK